MTTKAEIAQLLSRRLNMARKDALVAVDTTIDTIREAMLQGEKVSLVGFGTFDTKTKRARQGRNPRTSEKIDIPPKAITVFRPGKAFRERVNAEGHVPEAGGESEGDDHDADE